MIYDCVIVGAGWSGLQACKFAKEKGLSALVLEAREDLGGIWNYSSDPDTITVMKSTVMSSSCTVTESSDFYMKSEYGKFLRHNEALEYLQDYAEYFGLTDHLLFNSRVLRAYKADGIWRVETQDATYQSRNLVVCSGLHQHERNDIDAFNDYKGQVIHSGHIKHLAADSYSEADSILVYGGGETASDIVELLVETRAEIVWACPGGQHFFRKSRKYRDTPVGSFRKDAPRALDEGSAPLVQMLSSPDDGKPGYAWICRRSSTGSPTDYLGHGIPDWHNDIPFLRAFANKNGHVVDFARNGRVIPKRDVKSTYNSGVVFDDGEKREFSHVILCTGYTADFSFLPELLRQRPLSKLFKLIFDTGDASLLYIGFARPTISSIPLMTEFQCRYAFGVLAGELHLPDEKSMAAIAHRDALERDRFFNFRRRPPTLVSPFVYSRDLGRLAGIEPKYFRLFAKSPTCAIKAFLSPSGAPQMLLNDDAQRDAAVSRLWSRNDYQMTFLLPLVIFLSRVSLYGRLIDWLTERKFRQDELRLQRSANSEPAQLAIRSQ